MNLDVKGLTNHQIAQTGPRLVAAELQHRGAYDLRFRQNVRQVEVLASDAAQTRTVTIRVKPRREGIGTRAQLRVLHLEKEEATDVFGCLWTLPKPRPVAEVLRYA